MRNKVFFKKFGHAFFGIILIIGLYHALYAKESLNSMTTPKNFLEYEEERLALEGFIDEYFLRDGYFRTNLNDCPQKEQASGEDILSESVGLLMLNHLKRNEPEKFSLQVEILKEHFINENGLIKWRIRSGLNQKTVNSTIDDLRIVKALIQATEKWDRDDYKNIAKNLSANLLKYCVLEDTLKAYDSPTSPQAPLVYYDFSAMQLMGQFDQEWLRLANINIERILNHQVVGLPFFEDKWFSDSLGFPTLENLLIMLHLSEVGIKDPQSLTWLKKQLEQKGLFGRYSLEGKPLNSIQSPAIYATAARIGQLSNDRELYDLAMQKLINMQNLEDNKYYGGFIDLRQLTVYSFDHLMALLVY